MGLIVTNTGSAPLRWLEWGYEGPQTYNPATSLLIDSDSLVTSGFAGAQSAAALTGAYDPNGSGSTRVLADLFTTPVAVCGTGNLTHVGVFRVKARVFSSGAMHRLSWQAGDGPVSANAWTSGYDPPAAWREIDLGTITIPAGSGKWTGRIEAYAPANGSYQTNVDYLILVPVGAGYGKARATYSYRPGVIVAYDDFASTTAGNNLNARVAPAGGTWATSGSATDFQFADDLSGEQIKRITASDASPRFAVLGSSVFTDTQVDILTRGVALPAFTKVTHNGVIARWVDSSNYLRGYINHTDVDRFLVLDQRVAGVDTTLASVAIDDSINTSAVWRTLRLIVFASGRALLFLLDQTKTTTLVSVQASSTALATGGALDDGKPGLYDLNTDTTGFTRYYDEFRISLPAAEPIVIYPGRTLEITGADTIRQDSTGTYTGRPQSYRGSRFTVPVGTGRVYVRASAADLDLEPDPDGGGASQVSVQASFASRGLVVPRG